MILYRAELAEQELRDRDAREQEKAKLSNETEKFALQGQLSKQRDQIILKVTVSSRTFFGLLYSDYTRVNRCRAKRPLQVGMLLPNQTKKWTSRRKRSLFNSFMLTWQIMSSQLYLKSLLKKL
jgi:hypothetical protein